jgi:YVTN family beta-propeller protein
MKANKNLYSLALLSATLILVLIFVSSLASAAPYAYITNMDNKNVSVIDTATKTVLGTINVGFDPLGVVVNSNGTKIMWRMKLELSL